MPKKNPFGVSNDSRGNKKCIVGVKLPDYNPATFYLGKIHEQACLRADAIRKAWNAVHDRWYRMRDAPRAAWDATTYRIAIALGHGDTEVAVPYPYEPEQDNDQFAASLSYWLAELRSMFPMIRVRLDPPELAALYDEALAAEQQAEENAAQAQQKQAEAHQKKAAAAELQRTGQAQQGGAKLVEALEWFRDFLREKYKTPEGALSQHGACALRRLNSLLTHLGSKTETPLSAVNNSFLLDWLRVWENRPQGAKKRPVGRFWSKECIKLIRLFVEELHACSAFQWSKPAEYRVRPVRIKKTADERAAIPRVVRYKRDELAVLWEYCLPLERCWLLLGLNCGFGQGEIATLRIAEVNLSKARIGRKRTKTEVYSQWSLWPETVQALRWYLEKVRPESSSPYLFLTAKGSPLVSLTEGGNNRSQHIANHWQRVYDRIVKDHPDFRRLSFNKLRKTGASWMRHNRGAEVAKVYLSHGEREVLDHYTDPRFRALSKALTRFRKWLGETFSGVADPFPANPEMHNPSLSRGTIKRIGALRQQGYTLAKVSELVGVSMATVLKYTKRLPKEPA